MEEVYVSITGLRLKAPWHAPRFWYHATRSMAAAKSAKGCRHASARTIGGVHHTLTVWDDRNAMRKFLLGDAHRAAMRVFPKVGTGKTFGYQTEIVPNWSKARAIWDEKAKEYKVSD